MSPATVAAVLVAGAIGALGRYGISLALAKRSGFPWAVLLVNVIGAAIGGTVFALTEASAMSTQWHLIVLTGIAGGLTTFSTWSVETIQLIRLDRWRAALLSMTANLVLGLAVAIGAFLVTGALV